MDARTRRFDRVAAVRRVLAKRAQAEAALARAAEAKGERTVARLCALATDYQPPAAATDASALRRTLDFGATVAGAVVQASAAQPDLAHRRERAEAHAIEAERQRHLAETLRDAAATTHRREDTKAEQAAQSGTRPASRWDRAAIR